MTTTSFSYTGSSQSFTVPAGVTSVSTFGVTGTSYTDTPGPGSYTYEVGVLQ